VDSSHLHELTSLRSTDQSQPIGGAALTTTSITFIDGTEAVLDLEGDYPWAIIALPANQRQYRASLQAGIADARRRIKKLGARAKMSLSFSDDNIGGNKLSPGLLRATLAGTGDYVFVDEYHAAVKVDFKQGENSDQTFVRTGQSAEEAMRSNIDSQIEWINEGIDQALEDAASGILPAHQMKWRVEEWLTSEKEANDFDLRAHAHTGFGSVLSAVPTIRA